jgi:hypothetical protein
MMAFIKARGFLGIFMLASWYVLREGSNRTAAGVNAHYATQPPPDHALLPPPPFRVAPQAQRRV